MIRDAGAVSLEWRLLAAFVAVAVAAIALLTALAVLSTTSEVDSLVDRQRADVTQSIAQAVADAYAEAGGWAGADLTAAHALARAAGADVAIVADGADLQLPRMARRAAELPLPLASRAEGASGEAVAEGGSAAPRSPGVVDGTGGTPQSPTGASPQRSAAPVASPGRTQPAAVAPSSTPAPALPTAGRPGDGASRASGPALASAPAAAPRSGSSAPAAPTTVGTGSPSAAARTSPATALPSVEPSQATADGETTISVDGRAVGAVVVRFPPGASAASAELQARDVILRRVGLAALLALLVATAMSVYVSRRISRPVLALAVAAGSVERGERHPYLPTDAPGEIGYLARSFDRMTKALAVAEGARNALVADVAHELRTPVTVLRATLESLVDGVAEVSTAQLVSLHDETLKLGRVLEDLAALAAADAAALRLERHPVDLAEVADATAVLLSAPAADAHVTMSTLAEHVWVNGDETRLQQVLVNLVGNAIKYTPAGGRVTVVVRPVGEEAEIRVSDTGPGIPSDELPHVFDRFWRGTAAARATGSGVGLAVVKRLVEAHEGAVEVTAPEGEGASFVVRLPALHVGAQQVAPPSD